MAGALELAAALDTDALRAHLESRGLTLDGPLEASLITAGRSNLTYVLRHGDTRWVLRRPPLGHALPTAHDMRREWTVLDALAPTPVPVPTPILLCEDTAVIGAPFLLMEHVDGLVVHGAREAAQLAPDVARRSSEALVDGLAALHALDPTPVGLGALGRPEGYLERQVARWRRQWTSSTTAEHLGRIDALAAALEAHLPAQSRAAIVHGDYRLGNVILAADDPGRLGAIIDWEMATLGDPLADLGLLLAYCDPASEGITDGGSPIDANPGFLRPAALAERYAERTGLALAELDFYRALGLFKLAVIGQTIAARHRQGFALGAGLDAVAGAVETLVAAGESVLA